MNVSDSVKRVCLVIRIKCVPPHSEQTVLTIYTCGQRTGDRLAFGIPMIWREREKTYNWVLPLKRFLVIIRKLGRNSVTQIWIRQVTQCSIQMKYLYQFLHSCLPKKMKVIPIKHCICSSDFCLDNNLKNKPESPYCSLTYIGPTINIIGKIFILLTQSIEHIMLFLKYI